MALRQTYLSLKGKVPQQAMAVLVMRGRGNDELAPSWELLEDFNRHKGAYPGPQSGYDNAYSYAWAKSQYQARFTEQILSSPAAMAKLHGLAELARDGDIYLICYEGEDKPCHRKLLLDIAEKEFGAIVKREPLVPPEDAGIGSESDAACRPASAEQLALFGRVRRQGDRA